MQYAEHSSDFISDNKERIQSLLIKVNFKNQILDHDEISDLLKAYYKPRFQKSDYKYVLVHENPNPSIFEFERFDQKKQIIILNSGHLKKYCNGTLLVFEKKQKHLFWDYFFEYMKIVGLHVFEYIKYRRPYIKTDDEQSAFETAMLVELKHQRSYACLKFCIENGVAYFELPSNKMEELFPLKSNNYLSLQKRQSFKTQGVDEELILFNYQNVNFGIFIPQDWLVIEIKGGALFYESTRRLLAGTGLTYTIYGKVVYTHTGTHKTEYQFYKKPPELQVQESIPEYPSIRFLSEGYYIPGPGSVINNELFSDNSTVSNFEMSDVPKVLLDFIK